MADVTINSGPVEAEDKLRYVPRDKWRELMLARRRFLEVQLSYDCRCLVQFVNDAQEMYAELGFANPDAMILDGYGLEPKEIGVAVEWLTLNPPKEPISLERVSVLAKHGVNQHTPGHCNTRSTVKYGTREHWLGRLDRDGHHELAAEVRAGTVSANAAAEWLDYRKKLTPLEKIQKLWAKLDADGRKAHRDWTLKHCATCGRPGTWEGGEPDGMWCDACCDEAEMPESPQRGAA